MIKVVELMLDDEFDDVNKLKMCYLHGLEQYLSERGYELIPIDHTEWYSFERKILVDTDAPSNMIDTALDMENKKQKSAMGVLVS
ncbi:hypothetical protein CUJ83_08940 [Methanocella sp. CWC-04]|uniref:Uncharacterized protein n=1 Tax=Methanooceanicella nereidis TaxID=2052831 RepID=A0AAP2W6C0_9EURY|nr:hypothetical protein [Methanocella sp. CWC-04]MCD1295122.1 hypothetical protein [Methanocella sp. CWC-04]